MGYDLGGDSAEIPDKDKAAEKNAFSAGGPAGIHAPDGQGPGNAKAQDHYGFQDGCRIHYRLSFLSSGTQSPAL